MFVGVFEFPLFLVAVSLYLSQIEENFALGRMIESIEFSSSLSELMGASLPFVFPLGSSFLSE